MDHAVEASPERSRSPSLTAGQQQKTTDHPMPEPPFLRLSPLSGPVQQGILAAVPYISHFVVGHSMAAFEVLAEVVAGA